MAELKQPQKTGSNLLVRIAAAAVLVPIALFSAWSGGWVFVAFVTVLGAIMATEWWSMATKSDLSQNQKRKWLAIGVPYILLPLVCLMFLRADIAFGLGAVILVFVSVWSADTLAYFAGRTFGGPKLMPSVSPNKTWAGFFGAVLGGLIAAVMVFYFFGLTNLPAAAFLGAAIGGLEQGGDLFESAAKRKFGVKDSGSIIPGHGGVLDRVDGLMAAVVAAWLFGAVRTGDWQSAAAGLLSWPI